MINLKKYYRLQNITYVSLVVITSISTFLIYRHVNMSLLYFRQAEYFFSQNRFPEAIEGYKLYLKEHPDDKKARLALAKALVGNQLFDEAEQEYKKLLND